MAKRVRVQDTDKGFQKLVANLRDVRGLRVVVGIRGAKGAVRDDESGLTVVEYATANEFGTGRIPERSFMRSTFDEKRSAYTTALLAGLRRVVRGEVGGRQVLGLMGVRVARDIQLKIRRGPFRPNAPATIAQKGSSRPLIDSGRMRQSIDWELRTLGGTSLGAGDGGAA